MIDHISKVRKPRLSLRKAVDNHCKQCIYDKGTAGTWRKQVEDCTAPGCALYPVRPTSKYQDKTVN